MESDGFNTQRTLLVRNFIFISDGTYYQWTTTSIMESKKKKEKKQHATTLFEALATVKKERKYIFLYVLISAWLNNYSRWISFIRVTRDKENAFFPHCSGFYTKIRLLSFEIKSNTSYTSFKPSIWQHGKSIPGKLIILHSCKATCEISNSFFFLSFKTSLSNQLWVNTDDIKKKEV